MTCKKERREYVFFSFSGVIQVVSMCEFHFIYLLLLVEEEKEEIEIAVSGGGETPYS